MSDRNWGYVYVLRSGPTSHERYKIGWTGNLRTARARINRLKALNAHTIETMVMLQTRRPKTIEAELHNAFRMQHSHHEWYQLSKRNLLWITKKYHRNVYLAHVDVQNT